MLCDVLGELPQNAITTRHLHKKFQKSFTLISSYNNRLAKLGQGKQVSAFMSYLLNIGRTRPSFSLVYFKPEFLSKNLLK